jgi:heterodisulfide reductase subunit A2
VTKLNIEQSKVMVIGGGIAGLTAAWELSKSGVSVELVEKAGFLGGHAIQYACKATDTCQQCGACPVEKVLKHVVDDPNITIRLGAQVAGISKNGRFNVTLAAAPQGDAAPGDGCDDYSQNPTACAAQQGFSKNNAAVKDAGADGSVDVDAVVLASGFSPFDARRKSTYGYGQWPNVVTGLELEQTKRAVGRVVRPSDGQIPEKVAFIQCVGSRDERLGNLWCSKVCCPYALRTAMSMKHKHPETEITIFYMDIQNTGNDFPAFYNQCRDDLNFIRSIPVDVYPLENDRLRMRFVDEAEGVPTDVEFDLLVLSVGMMPGADNEALGELLGLERNQDGFFAAAERLNAVGTTAEGIFLAGTVQGPKTIADSMAHAGQSAREVMKYLGGAE